MRTPAIIYRCVYPPIPDRSFDWCAWHDGEEEDGHSGWGSIPEEALADLDRLDQERAEALEDADLDAITSDGVES